MPMYDRSRQSAEASPRYHLGARVRLLRGRQRLAEGAAFEEGVIVNRHKTLCYEVRLQNNCLATYFEWDLELLDQPQHQD
jgi:hypothetical protein